MPLDVERKRLHRGISIQRLFLERLGNDGIEIAAQIAHLGRAGHAAHQRRLHVQHFEFVGAERAAVGRIRARAGEQLEQDDAERVHVGGDGHGLAGELFRAPHTPA